MELSIKHQSDLKKAAAILKSGGVGVLPTDTLYGIVGSALNKKTVERIYRLRRRDRKKPLIVLISSRRDLSRFGIKPNRGTASVLKKNWPGKVSIILPCPKPRWRHLHRGTQSIAFRFPKDRLLRLMLKKTGPLVAPSANIAGQPEALTISQAKSYFGSKADFYLEAGKKQSKASTLIKIQNGKLTVLRQGAVKVK